MRAWIDRRFDEPSIDGEVIKLSYSNSIKKYKRMIVCQLHIDVEKWEVRMEVEEVPYGKGRKEYISCTMPFTIVPALKTVLPA